MANYFELHEDLQALFDNAMTAALLTDNVIIKVLGENKLKEIFKVVKSNELLKYRTSDDVTIIVNEKIFEQLPDDQKLIVVEEAIAYISYDSENDKVVITKPDFLAHSGVLRKHGYPTIEVVRESITTLYQAEKQAEEEAKQRTE